MQCWSVCPHQKSSSCFRWRNLVSGFCSCGHHLRRVRNGRPNQQICYRWHNSPDNLATQAPPLRQIRGGVNKQKQQKFICTTCKIQGLHTCRCYVACSWSNVYVDPNVSKDIVGATSPAATSYPRRLEFSTLLFQHQDLGVNRYDLSDVVHF